MPPAFKYYAFISYSRQDSKAGAWLQRRLEWFRFPLKLVQADRRPPNARYVRPIYRDKTNLEVTDEHYWTNIRRALGESRYLIVLCSPHAAASEPVDMEVAHFLETHGGDASLVAPIIVSGNVTSAGADAALCPALRALGDTLINRNLPSMVPDAVTAEQDAWEHGFVALVSYLLRLERTALGDHIQRETKRQARVLRRWLVAVGMLTLIAAVSAGLALAAKREVAAERDARAQALADVLRLADAKKVRDLMDEVDQLWPLHPDRADAMADWMKRTRAVCRNRPQHEATLARLRRQALAHRDGEPWRFPSPELDWQHAVVTTLLAGLDELEGRPDPGRGLLAAVEHRHEFVSTLRRRSVDEAAQLWDATIAAIWQSPRYTGLKLKPQLGLIPLGPDPASGLFEFAHLGSGEIPQRDAATGVLPIADHSAFVLVLIPPTTFLMGAQRNDPAAPHFDPAAQADEAPVHEVSLSPFFISKWECTQRQWQILTGENPSQYKAGQVVKDRRVTLRNPVEQVSWTECQRWATRFGLELPSEAQWECACRAGTETPWSSGATAASLNGVANIADFFLAAHGGPANWKTTPEVNDGHFVHAPAGSFAANAWGLHDMMGNVYEWCADVYGAYAPEPQRDPRLLQSAAPAAVRVGRGGSWSDPAEGARVTPRTRDAPGTRNDSLGVRFARPVLP